MQHEEILNRVHEAREAIYRCMISQDEGLKEKKIRNDKLWGRFIKGFNVCHRHCFQG